MNNNNIGPEDYGDDAKVDEYIEKVNTLLDEMGYNNHNPNEEDDNDIDEGFSDDGF